MSRERSDRVVQRFALVMLVLPAAVTAVGPAVQLAALPQAPVADPGVSPRNLRVADITATSLLLQERRNDMIRRDPRVAPALRRARRGGRSRSGRLVPTAKGFASGAQTRRHSARIGAERACRVDAHGIPTRPCSGGDHRDDYDRGAPSGLRIGRRRNRGDPHGRRAAADCTAGDDRGLPRACRRARPQRPVGVGHAALPRRSTGRNR